MEIDPWGVHMGELGVAMGKLATVTRVEGYEPLKGEDNTRAWEHQRDINEELRELLHQLKGRVDWLTREMK